MAKQHLISKSRFVSGIQCHKKLYLEMFRKDLRPPLSQAKERLFASGRKVGEIAWNVFPGGKDASMVNFDIERSVKLTDEWLNKAEATIYEAAFRTDGVLAFLDILHHRDGERIAIEVKSSTGVKDYHYTDAAIQYWVMKRAGWRPDHFILMHINNEYIREGEIEADKLFKRVDITNAVVDLQPWVSENLEKIRRVIENGLEPVVDIGPHCDSPFECDFKQYCWQHIPEHSVFELSNANGKDWELYNSGVIKLVDIPPEFNLNPKQQIQVNAVRERSGYMDKEEIRKFLAEWTFPLYFFDFETVGPAVPLLDGSSPFEQIPFQYSLHVVSEEGSEPSHHEFLADPAVFRTSDTDPREEIIRSMRNDLKHDGSIIAYNARFEKGIINRLAILYPEHAEYLLSLNNRFVDLWDVFRKYWWYEAAMKGSASIKSVLPSVAPEFSYLNLEIQEGAEASAVFLSLIDGDHSADISEKQRELLSYCERDTEGMVILWKKLMALCS